MKKNQFPEIKINNPGEGFKASLRSRVIVALILVALFVPCVFLGGWFFFGMVSIIAVVGIWELCRSTGKKYGWWVIAYTYIVTLVYIFWFVLRNRLIYDLDPGALLLLTKNFKEIDISALSMASSMVGYFCIAILDKNFSFADAAHFFIFTFLLGLGIQSACFLRYSPYYYLLDTENVNAVPLYSGGPLFDYLWSAMFIVFACGGACVNDIFAYFGGIFFGKHKLNERVSPKKTWEGFAFGLVTTSLLLMGFGFGTAAAGLPILPFFTLDNWFWIVIFSIVVPLVADVGDLALSLIKRHYGIKDYGTILRGHGGVLDRFDSMLFVAIVLSSLVMVIVGFGIWIH